MGKEITESQMLSRLEVGSILLPPLVVRKFAAESPSGGVDARIEVGVPGEDTAFRFAVESKANSTPRSVQLAVAQAKAAVRDNEHPMIQIPYLSAERVAELEQQLVSGVDLCGNGVVIVPGRLWLVRTGQPNQYRDSRPLMNPYAGRSALVARMLLTQRRWESLSSLTTAIQERGAAISLSQASKAVRALEEDLIVTKDGGSITLREPLRLLDKLGEGWSRAGVKSREAFRVAKANWATALSFDNRLRWVVTGESSAARYVTFWQSGPLIIAVSDLSLAKDHLEGEPEPVRSFADIELVETSESGVFFAFETDEKGIRWASRLQTWLELQAGDARQREAAHDLRARLLQELTP